MSPQQKNTIRTKTKKVNYYLLILDYSKNMLSYFLEFNNIMLYHRIYYFIITSLS